MAQEKLQVTVPSTNKWHTEDVERKVEELGLENKSELILKALDLYMNFDNVFLQRIENISKNVIIPEYLVIQNMIIKQFALDAAKVDTKTWGGSDRLMSEFQFVNEEGIRRTLTGESLFNNLKESYISEIEEILKMKIVTLKDSKDYSKYELNEFNNLADRPTEFIRFISFLCRKYKLSVSKIGKCNACERNLGIELLGAEVLIQFFYEYDENILELVISCDSDEILKKRIENDILTYVNKVNHKKGDKVIDTYGEKYILQEDITPTNTVKRYKAIRVCDNTECIVYNHFICPDLD